MSTLVGLRIGTDERETCVASLQDHFAAGRLEVDELESRIHRALTATTAADLEVLVHDLPRRSRKQWNRRRTFRRAGWVITAAALGVGAVFGIGSLVGGSPPAVPDQGVFCESTGQTSQDDCPVTSAIQRRILFDAMQAQESALQLNDYANEHSDRPQLTKQAERAELLAERAQAASLRAQQLVRSDGDLPKESLTGLASAADKSAAEIEKLLDQATTP